MQCCEASHDNKAQHINIGTLSLFIFELDSLVMMNGDHSYMKRVETTLYLSELLGLKGTRNYFMVGQFMRAID